MADKLKIAGSVSLILAIIAMTLALTTGSTLCSTLPYWQETDVAKIYYCADKDFYRACNSLSSTNKTCYHILTEKDFDYDPTKTYATIPVEYDKYTDDQLTDAVFTNLIESKESILGGEAIFEVKNIFDREIPIKFKFTENYNGIKESKYFIQEIVYYNVSIPDYSKPYKYPCIGPLNESMTCEGKDVIGYHDELKVSKTWKEVENIPALYKGLIKLEATWDKIAYGTDAVEIDWVPYIEITADKDYILSKDEWG